MAKNYVIIDTDCGVDDAVAILYALNNPEWEILAITCCAGNTNLQSVCDNVLRLLAMFDKGNIPVYSGCCVSLIAAPLDASYYHGDDGFGGKSSEYSTCGLKVAKDYHASNALVNLVKDRPGVISLIALGPLTNLAVAQRLDPEFSKRLKELVIMGGNTEGLGNIAVAAEFNFACDPEAARVVLSEVPQRCPVKIVPWETCLRSGIPWEEFNNTLKSESAKAKLIKKIYATGIESQLTSGRAGFICCDFIAMVALMNPNAIVSEKRYPVRVELQGEYTRGMMVLERRPRYLQKMESESKPSIVFNMDVRILTDAFKTMLRE